jgi:hypothetical protein
LTQLHLFIVNNSKSNRKFVPSDDEDDEDEESEDDDDEDDDDDDDEKDKEKEHPETRNHKIDVPKPTIITPPPTSTSMNAINSSKKGKIVSRIPQPSDDEESDQDDISDDSEDEGNKNTWIYSC